MGKPSSKNVFLTIIIIASLAVIAGVSLVFGYLNQSLHRKYPTDITAANVTFRFNGMEYLDDIGSSDLDLYKGEPAETTLLVQVFGSASLIVDYEINFKLNEEASEIVNAIEVYKYDGNRYQFHCMLGDIGKPENSIKSARPMVTHFEDELDIYFVYSAAAGSYYDGLINKNEADFTLTAEAAASISDKTDDYVFVTDEVEFTEAFESKSENGSRTVVLSKDVTLTAADGVAIDDENDVNYGQKYIKSKEKVGIDLNGHTLTLSDVHLIVDCQNNPGRGLGIKNSKATGGLLCNSSDDKKYYLSVINAVDAYLIDNNLQIDDTFTQNVRVDHITSEFTEYEDKNDNNKIKPGIFEDIVSIIKERAVKFTDGTEGVNKQSILKRGDDVSFLFDGLYSYLNCAASPKASSPFALTFSDNSVIQYENGAYRITKYYDTTQTEIIAEEDYTGKYQYMMYLNISPAMASFLFNDSSATKSANIYGYVNVRGNSPFSIAESMYGSLPSPVERSLFLPVYDDASGSYIEWFIRDDLGGDLLDSDGRYRKNGLDAITGKVDSLADRNVEMYIKVTHGAESETHYFEPAVQVASAAERTVRLYDSSPVIIAAEDVVGYDIYNEMLYERGEDVGKYQLIGIFIYKPEFKFAKDDKGYDVNNDPDDYLIVENSIDHYDESTGKYVHRSDNNYKMLSINPDAEIPQNTITPVDVEIVFFYGDRAARNRITNNDNFITNPADPRDVVIPDDSLMIKNGLNVKSYSVKRDVQVTGKNEDTTGYDVGYRLQSAFSENKYLSGDGYKFYAYGALLPSVSGKPAPVLIDYTVQGSAADYVAVYYEFVPTPPAETSNQIAYFKRGNINGAGEFENNENGEYYKLIDNLSEYSGVIYERKATIEVRPSKITKNEAHTVYVTATLYSIEDAASSPYYFEDSSKNKIYGNITYLTDRQTINGKSLYGYGYTYTDTSGNETFILVYAIEENNDGTLKYYDVEKDQYIYDKTQLDYSKLVKVYTSPTGVQQKLGYTMTLAVEGVIRNGIDIPDYNLYIALCDIFDENGDGLITASEAENWEYAKTSGSRYLEKATFYYNKGDNNTYYMECLYVNLISLNISSLKGIEHFTGIEGLSILRTGTSDISYLKSLTNLVYLQASNNSITDLSPLSYADKLVFLAVDNNYITSIEPLRYLKSLSVLHLNGNKIYDFEPLTNLTTLRTIHLYGMEDETSSPLTSNANIMYNFALIYINNKHHVIEFMYTHNNLYGVNEIKITAPMEVAAMVMRDLEDINRVSKVLYLPTSYYYNSVKYDLYWYTPPDQTELIINQSDAKGSAAVYSISSPLYDKKVTICLKVVESYNGQDNISSTYNVSRYFNVTLETSTSTASTAGIYIYSEELTQKNGVDTYVLLSDIGNSFYGVISDEQLLAVLFERFNYNTTGTISNARCVDKDNNTIYSDAKLSEYQVISKADINHYTGVGSGSVIESNYDLSYSGITDFTGIEYFKDLFIRGLDLSGNILSEENTLEPLTGLTNLQTLTLGGQTYDFTELIVWETDAGGAKTAVSNGGMLGSLQKLYVYQAYGLDTDEVLNALYQVWCNSGMTGAKTGVQTNGTDIYIANSNTVWNPYATALPKAVQNAKTTISLMGVGDSESIYYDLVDENGQYYYEFILYGVTYRFTAFNTLSSTDPEYNDRVKYYSKTTTTTQWNTLFDFDTKTGEIKVNNSNSATQVGNDESSYAKITLKSTISDGRSKISYSNYYVQIVMQDPSKNIFLLDLDTKSKTNGQFVSLHDLVGSRDLRGAVQTQIFNYMNWYNGFHNTTGAVDTDAYVNRGIRLKNGVIEATRTLNGIIYTANDTMDISSIKDLLMRDLNNTDKGATGINNGTAGKLYYVYDGTNERCYLATDILKSTTNGFTATSMQIYGGVSDDGMNSLKGLHYFTTLTTLDLSHDIIIDDWTELYNVVYLTITYSSINMSNLTAKLPNLSRLTITNFYSFKATAENFKCLQNLQLFYLYSKEISYYLNANASYPDIANVDDFSFLEGLIDESTGNCQLIYLRLTSSSGTIQSQPYYVSDANAASVARVYSAALETRTKGQTDDYKKWFQNNYMQYYLGSPESATATGYFHVINSAAWYCTGADTSTASVAWSSDTGSELNTKDFTEKDADLTAYNTVTGNMRDLGLKINTTYWLNTTGADNTANTANYTNHGRKYELSASDTLRLPTGTGYDYYGLEYGDKDISNKDVVVRNYGIAWTAYISQASNVNTYKDPVEIKLNNPDNATYVRTDPDTNGTYYSLNFASYGNCFIMIVGVLDNITGYAQIPSGATNYAFYYQFVVDDGNKTKGYYGDGCYAEVEDATLRMWLFANKNFLLSRDIYKLSDGSLPIGGDPTEAVNFQLSTATILYQFGFYSWKMQGLGNILYDSGSRLRTHSNWSVGYFVYSIKGINVLLNKLGVAGQVTSFSLTNQRFRDISPLFGLTNITSIDISNDIYKYGYVSLTDSKDSSGNTIKEMLPKLTSLKFNYQTTITPDDLKLLASRTTKTITSLSLYQTQCMYAPETIAFLRGICDKTLAVALNGGEGVDTYTAEQYDAFLSAMKLYNGGFTNSDDLYSNGYRNVQLTYGGEVTKSYTFSMSTYTSQLIKANVANSVNVKVQISSSPYYQLTNTYICKYTAPYYDTVSGTTKTNTGSDVVYTTTGQTAWKFGSTGQYSIADFDTELIAYLVYGSRTLTNTGGNYILSGSQTISANVGIRTFNGKSGNTAKNAGMLLGGGTISILRDTSSLGNYASQNPMAYEDRELDAVVKGNYKTDIDNRYNDDYKNHYNNNRKSFISGISDAALVYLTRLKTTYYDYKEYIAYMPSSIWYKGVEYKIDYAIGWVSNANIVKYSDGSNGSANKLTADMRSAGKGWQITFNKDSVWLEGATDGTPYYFTVKATISNGTNTYTVSSNQITILKTGASTVVLNFDYYIEVDINHITGGRGADGKVASGTHISSAIAAGTVTEGYFYITKENTATVYYESASAVKISTFYEYSSGSGNNITYKYYGIRQNGAADGDPYAANERKVYVVAASSVFESQRFIEMLYISYFRSNTVDGGGFVMRLSNIYLMPSIELKYQGNASRTNVIGISSIEGIQIFYNLTIFTSYTGSALMDISPLTTLALKTFYMSNSESTYNFVVTDFTPLINGASRDTLEIFGYNCAASTQMTDLSFVLDFSKLKEVYIAAGSSSDSYNNGLAYFNTSSGKYVLSTLYSKGIYVYARSNAADKLNIPYYSSISTTGGGLTGGITVYALLPASDYKAAAEVLDSYGKTSDGLYDTSLSPYIGINYTGGSQLNVASCTVNPASTWVTVTLNATVNYQGSLYLIDWESAGTNVEVTRGEYYLASDMTVGGKPYYKNTAYTYETANIIAQSVEYYVAQSAGINCLTVNVSVDTGGLGEKYNATTKLYEAASAQDIYKSLCGVHNARIICRVNIPEGTSGTPYAYERMFTFDFSNSTVHM